MKKIYILVFFLSACTMQNNYFPRPYFPSQHTAKTKADAIKYPYFAMNFGTFFVTDQDSNGRRGDPDSPTADDHRRARQINTLEKHSMLGQMDIVRFVVNHEIFARELLSSPKTFQAAQYASGPVDTINLGDELDHERLLKVLRETVQTVDIVKQQMPHNILALGAVSREHAYVSGNLNRSYILPIVLPNRDKWDEIPYRGEHNSGYIHQAAILFHEIIHNMGFVHDAGRLPSTSLVDGGKMDAVNGAEQIFIKAALEIFENGLDKNKNRLELRNFRDFYPTIHKNQLFTTIADGNYRPVGTRTRGGDNDIVVCILTSDGVYKMGKLPLEDIYGGQQSP